MAIPSVLALVLVGGGVLLFRLSKSLDHTQRIVLAVLVVLAVAYMGFGFFQGAMAGAEYRRQHDGR